jgi:type VI secretion system protein ImpM
LLLPSVDRVGRYFPLTLVWPTPLDLSTLEVAVRFQRGFERAEQLLLDTLALERFEFAEFDRHVMDLAAQLEELAPPGARRLTRAAAGSALAGSSRPRCISLRAVSALDVPVFQILGDQLDAGSGGFGLWWTDGSSVIEPICLMTAGLPEPSHYSAMLDGAWVEAGWSVAETEPERTARAVREAPEGTSIQISSAALTDRGPVRSVNQDAFIERPDRGLWAVADGMGGLSDGEVASRMVCDSLADAPILAGMDEQAMAVIAQLRGVNDYLRRAATRPIKPVQSGSTVVVLVIRQYECAILWAGDSRAYRLRDAELTQLSTDHSWIAQGGSATGGADDQAITRAVGAEDELMVDVVRGDVRANDRFLLCSDGICRALDPAQLSAIMSAHAADDCCHELIAQSIAQGGTDNLTAVIVDCIASDADEPGAGDAARS